MPTGDPSRQPTEEFDPEQTLFFSRRKKRVNLLPIIVGCILVLGSGALLAWALTRADRKPKDEAYHPEPGEKDPFAGRPVLSPGEAKSLENPPVATASPVPAVVAAVTPPPRDVSSGTPVPAVVVPFDDTKPVRRAIPVPSPADPVAGVSAGSIPPDGSTQQPVSADTAINLDISNADNAQVRNDVLRRIDLMPGVSQGNKDKLYASVDHARRMGRVLTVPFEKGEAVVRSADVDRLKEQLKATAVQAILDDPTMVFVILGYADQKGNEKINSDISLSRARSVMDALRDKCGLQNVMHSVAMGGSTLFSAQQVEKNRVVEIWAVLP